MIMAKQVSPAAIGAFVLGAIGTVIIAAVVLGSGKLFQQRVDYICMFQSNLNGLKPGAPVKIKGVQIGTVKQISLRLHKDEGELRQIEVARRPIPVIIEVDPQEFDTIGAGSALTQEQFDGLIRAGLRARLATQSFLTGVLYVEIGFHPETPAHLFLVPGSGPYPEIPTITTHLEQIRNDATRALAKIGQVDFHKLAESISDAGESFSALAGDPDLHQAIGSVNRLASDPQLKMAVDHLDYTLTNLDRAVVSVRNTIDRTAPRIDPLLASLQKTSDDMQTALAQAQSTLASAQLVLSPGSPMAYRLNTTLKQLADASLSVRQLADYLERNPSALIRGRYVSDGYR
jgi:paraquat-inducible protein B